MPSLPPAADRLHRARIRLCRLDVLVAVRLLHAGHQLVVLEHGDAPLPLFRVRERYPIAPLRDLVE
jgi:hypothetical protein